MKVNYNGKQIMTIDQRVSETRSHNYKSAKSSMCKKRTHRLVRLDQPIKSPRHLWQTLKRVWYYGIRITFCLILIAGYVVSTHQPPKTEEKAQAEVTEPPSYPQVIGYIGQEKDLFDRYFGSEANIARAICKAENTAEDPNATHLNRDGSTDQGLCQINTINKKYYQGEDIFDPEVNIRTAKKIKDSQDWYAWTQYKNGAYEQYLK